MKTTPSFRRSTAFTMVELALCIAVAGIALVAIIGVLPTGMNVQKKNREETIINADAQYWLEAIRNGSIGLQDLTNYVDVIRITSSNNITGSYDVSHFVGARWKSLVGFNPPQNRARFFDDINPKSGYQGLISAANIVGLMSQPKVFPHSSGNSSKNLTNEVLAIVRAITGSAIEKPARDPRSTNFQAALDFAFKYAMTVELLPYAAFSPDSPDAARLHNMGNSLYDLKLTFEWPVFFVGGKLRTGQGRRVFRTQVAGALYEEPIASRPEAWDYNRRYLRRDEFVTKQP
ncbi:MAG: hypothetical protein EXS36_12080 [Pedosphaera sp.]|nr:hypothetical protein [Pedosphaera sp.]